MHQNHVTKTPLNTQNIICLETCCILCSWQFYGTHQEDTIHTGWAWWNDSEGLDCIRIDWCISDRVKSQGGSTGKGLPSPYSTNGEGVEAYETSAMGKKAEEQHLPLCLYNLQLEVMYSSY